jgi:hypothetical protein
MYYSVVPRELETQLLEPLRAHYAGEGDIEVIVDRRRSQRRSRPVRGLDEDKRVLRDRRRRRIAGELPPLFGERPAAA